MASSSSAPSGSASSSAAASSSAPLLEAQSQASAGSATGSSAVATGGMSDTSGSGVLHQTAKVEPVEFTIDIIKSEEDQSIGVRMVPHDSDCFEITEIIEGGLVDCWNRRHKDEKAVSIVRVADRVIAANDYPGKDEIGCVIRSGLELRLTILRLPPSRPAPMPDLAGAAGAMPQLDADSMAQMGKVFEDPEMMKQMSNMMSNIPPEQLEKMMAMSANMFSAQGGGSSSAAGPGGVDQAAMKQMMDDPEMTKAAEEMMAKMSPEALASIAKASGLKLDDNQAKAIARYTPWLKRVMRVAFCCNRGRQRLIGKGGYIAASFVVMLGVAYQSGYLG